jgi:hypothetical protein
MAPSHVATAVDKQHEAGKKNSLCKDLIAMGLWPMSGVLDPQSEWPFLSSHWC